MNELDREIKDLEVAYYFKLFSMALNDILEIAQGYWNKSKEERLMMGRARFLRLREDLANISKFRERMNMEKEEKIEKLKELVIKQTKTAAKLDPLRKEKYWKRLNDAGFYDDGYSESTIEYVREMYQLSDQ